MKETLRAGDWIEVRSADEILKTLDAEGNLEGLPFMPEMLPFCGQRFRLLRVVEKTCVDIAPPNHMAEFPGEKVVLLDDPRCSGEFHGQCQKGCRLFWKLSWLKKVTSPHPVSFSPATINPSEHLDRFLISATENQYHCQSTAIPHITQRFSKWSRLKKCAQEIACGNYTFWEMLQLTWVPIWAKVQRKRRGIWPIGPHKRTPEQTLNLQSGEWVEIKSAEEIMATLDQRGRNRGLVFEPDMLKFCGRKFRVRNRLDHMISESDGKLISLKNTVILEGITCECPYSIGGCPRGLFQFWREIWLRRIDPSPDAAT